MKRFISILILIFFFSINVYALDYTFNGNYGINTFSNKVESLISENFDSTLVAYTEVDDSLRNAITINLDILTYDENLLTIDGNVELRDNIMPLHIELYESNINILFNTLDKLLFNIFNGDLDLLFESNNSYKLDYQNNVDSFINYNNKYKAGNLIILNNYENKKSLAIVDALYGDYATINYLYNPTNIRNTQIFNGPKNQIGFNFGYDFYENIISIGADYYYLRGLFFPLTTSFLGASSTYYLNQVDNSQNVSSDLSLLIEFPLSKISNNSFLSNFTIYNKTKLGLIYDNPIEFHSVFEVGLKTYLSTKIKLSAGYKMDSYNQSYYNALISMEFMF